MNSAQQERNEQTMEAALKPFGWTCGPDFWKRYYSDPWVFNLANVVERQADELRSLRSAVWRIVGEVDECDHVTTEGGDRFMLTDLEADAVRAALEANEP